MPSNSQTTRADESQQQIKLIAVGDTGVGKSSILSRFVNDKFNEFSEPTLGAAFLTKKQALSTGKNIEFHIWDTAGQEKYKSIAPIYYRQAKIALCVYDITSSHSYQIMKKWIEELQEQGPKQIVLAIVGNKIDRYDDDQVDYNEAKEYANKIGAIFRLVSAKENKNIQDLFTTVAELAISKNQPKTAGTSSKRIVKDKKKSSCC